ncbi:hypothetical protein FOA52_010750 [Chlamydomonas sp. UWO 241]|nr:hypothetical protein FOA52_010750 [Chlamydomonas sp. UWO 241]
MIGAWSVEDAAPYGSLLCVVLEPPRLLGSYVTCNSLNAGVVLIPAFEVWLVEEEAQDAARLGGTGSSSSASGEGTEVPSEQQQQQQQQRRRLPPIRHFTAVARCLRARHHAPPGAGAAAQPQCTCPCVAVQSDNAAAASSAAAGSSSGSGPSGNASRGGCGGGAGPSSGAEEGRGARGCACDAVSFLRPPCLVDLSSGGRRGQQDAEEPEQGRSGSGSASGGAPRWSPASRAPIMLACAHGCRQDELEVLARHGAARAPPWGNADIVCLPIGPHLRAAAARPGDVPQQAPSRASLQEALERLSEFRSRRAAEAQARARFAAVGWGGGAYPGAGAGAGPGAGGLYGGWAGEGGGDGGGCGALCVPLSRPRASHPMAGTWVGTYGVHGMEFISMSHSPGRRGGGGGGSGWAQPGVLTATKLTGDYHVPAGELSFRIQLGDPSEAFSPAVLPPTSPDGSRTVVGFPVAPAPAGGAGGMHSLLGTPGSLLRLPPGYTSRVDLTGHRLRVRTVWQAMAQVAQPTFFAPLWFPAVCVLLEPEWGPEGGAEGDGSGDGGGSGADQPGCSSPHGSLPGGGGCTEAGRSWWKLLRAAGDACRDGRPLLFGMAWTHVSTFSLFARVEGLPGL